MLEQHKDYNVYLLPANILLRLVYLNYFQIVNKLSGLQKVLSIYS